MDLVADPGDVTLGTVPGRRIVGRADLLRRCQSSRTPRARAEKATLSGATDVGNENDEPGMQWGRGVQSPKVAPIVGDKHEVALLVSAYI